MFDAPFEIALLGFGVLLLVAGVTGKVQAREMSFGTNHPLARLVLGIVGAGFAATAIIFYVVQDLNVMRLVDEFVARSAQNVQEATEETSAVVVPQSPDPNVVDPVPSNGDTPSTLAPVPADVSVEVVLERGDGRGGKSDDSIMIVFSKDSAAELGGPEELYQQMIQGLTLRRSDQQDDRRRHLVTTLPPLVRDTCYVQVVNFGDDGWAGQSVRVYLDGQSFLDAPLYPRARDRADNGIEHFNVKNWDDRTYWESTRLPGCAQ